MRARAARSRPDWVPSDLYPFEDRWEEIDGNLVHYIDEGRVHRSSCSTGTRAGRSVGAMSCSASASRFRCVALDYPGFGLSRGAPAYDFRPPSHSAVVEALVDRFGLRDLSSTATPGAGRSVLPWPFAGPS